ncbi:MAG: SDR family oxidoreductase [Spirochaetaceae bacterium]
MSKRPIALITGASRKNGIGAACAIELSKNGWDIALTYWTSYDKTMPWGSLPEDILYISEHVKLNGANIYCIEADLSNADSAPTIFDKVESEIGMVSALILSHCYSVDKSILTSTIEDFDLHFSINTKASWLLIREHGKRFKYESIPGRIIAMTSDHTAFNMPYGASKGALDRIVVAAAEELKDIKINSNVINPGANDTGWMSPEFKEVVKEKTYQNRVGTPQDTAKLVKFLCSEDGEWINGQLLCSDGGVSW